MNFNINKIFRLRIKGKLIIAFAALSILPMLVVGYVGITSNVKSLENVAIENIKHDLDIIKERVSGFFQGIDDHIYFLTSSREFLNFIDALHPSSEWKLIKPSAELHAKLLKFSERSGIFY